MEGYVTVLAEMESAATLPVLMHSSSTVSDGPGDPGGSRWQCCFTVRICVSKCRPECVRSVYVCATVFVRLGPDVCIHMVRWRHIWIVLALGQMHVVNILLCVWLSLHWTPPNLVFVYPNGLILCPLTYVWSCHYMVCEATWVGGGVD